MPALLVIVAILLTLVGLTQVNQATLGVGVMALACLCGILARVAQAKSQQTALLKALAELKPTSVEVVH